MEQEQFCREKLYQSTMATARLMLKNGLISEDDYRVIDTRMVEKYSPKIGTLFSEIDLIVSE